MGLTDGEGGPGCGAAVCPLLLELLELLLALAAYASDSARDELLADSAVRDRVDGIGGRAD